MIKALATFGRLSLIVAIVFLVDTLLVNVMLPDIFFIHAIFPGIPIEYLHLYAVGTALYILVRVAFIEIDRWRAFTFGAALVYLFYLVPLVRAHAHLVEYGKALLQACALSGVLYLCNGYFFSLTAYKEAMQKQKKEKS